MNNMISRYISRRRWAACWMRYNATSQKMAGLGFWQHAITRHVMFKGQMKYAKHLQKQGFTL